MPYPENLYTVPACLKCNQAFSLDEEYVAVLIEWIKGMENGTGNFEREHINRIIEHSSAIEERLFASLLVDESGKQYFKPEHNRIKNIVLKHAIGHVFYDLGMKLSEKPSICAYKPNYLLTNKEIESFNLPIRDTVWPEVGSRLMQRQVECGNSWITVQEKNYRYYVHQSTTILVRIVFRELLFCEVVWEI